MLSIRPELWGALGDALATHDAQAYVDRERRELTFPEKRTERPTEGPVSFRSLQKGDRIAFSSYLVPEHRAGRSP